jgi:hypothetical protein
MFRVLSAATPSRTKAASPNAIALGNPWRFPDAFSAFSWPLVGMLDVQAESGKGHMSEQQGGEGMHDVDPVLSRVMVTRPEPSKGNIGWKITERRAT